MTKVSIASAPKFQMGSEEFGPYENSTAELPAYAAAYLVLKGRASLTA